MRYPATEKLEIIRLVEQSQLPVRRTLDNLGVSRLTFYLYGRLSHCKQILNVLRDQLQTSIRRQPGVPGAPKWQIRTRAPLQLVGLKGLDKSQVCRAPVRSVQSIFPSTRKLQSTPQAAAR